LIISCKLGWYRYFVLKDFPRKGNTPLFETVPLSSQTKAHKEQERVGETDLNTSQRLRAMSNTTLSNSLPASMTSTDWLVALLALGTVLASCLLAFLFQAYTRHALATLPYNIVLHLNGYLVQVVLASFTIRRKSNLKEAHALLLSS
jgi:hypothetical protein